MKKFLVMFVVGVLSISASFAAEPNLVDEIHEKVAPDLSTVELDQYATDYVVVSFHIENGKIKINTIDGTQLELKKLIVKELVQMNVESNYDEDATYRYKFTFEKV